MVTIRVFKHNHGQIIYFFYEIKTTALSSQSLLSYSNVCSDSVVSLRQKLPVRLKRKCITRKVHEIIYPFHTHLLHVLF